MKRVLTFLAAFTGLFAGSAAYAAPLNTNAPLLQGPAITAIVSPYDEALACLNGKLTAEQKKLTYAVGIFPDKTGKVNYAAPDASGSFLGQGYEDALLTSLAKTGVQTVNMSPVFRGLFDWSVARTGRNARISLLLPDVLVSGSFNTADVQPGGGAELIGILDAGYRQNRILVGFDANATAMPFNATAQAAAVLTAFAYNKQVVGYENKLGVTSFFGGGNSRSLIGFNLGSQRREALQHVGKTMMDVVAFRVVRDVTGERGCDTVFQLAETPLAESR